MQWRPIQELFTTDNVRKPGTRPTTAIYKNFALLRRRRKQPTGEIFAIVKYGRVQGVKCIGIGHGGVGTIGNEEFGDF